MRLARLAFCASELELRAGRCRWLQLCRFKNRSPAMIQKIDVELVLSNLADLPNSECCVFNPICGSPLHKGCLSPTAVKSFDRLDAPNIPTNVMIWEPDSAVAVVELAFVSMICRKEAAGLVRIAHPSSWRDRK